MLRLVKADRPKKRLIRRRALFQCTHPDIGLSVLDRKVFKRFFGTLDECRQKDNLHERAKLALRSVYGKDFPEFTRGPMFLLSGLTDHVTECTVFRFGTMFDQAIFRAVPEQHYIPVEKHPSAAMIHRALMEMQHPESRRSVG